LASWLFVVGDDASAPEQAGHGCGNVLANKGEDRRAIQGWLGHRSITSAAVYTRWRRTGSRTSGGSEPGQSVQPHAAQTGGIIHAAIPAPVSIPITKTVAPITMRADLISDSAPRKPIELASFTIPPPHP
jgi:hypothetical protein